MIKNVAVLLTCFNRKQTTIRCLSALRKQEHNFGIDVYLCDDCSTDGTGEAVAKEFPEVHVVQGTGSLFWNRGMLRAWEAAKAAKEYDAYIWLNDDAMLYQDALQQMVDTSAEQNDKAILCGEFCSSKGEFTYGGKDRKKHSILPNGTCQPLYFLNGNCVLIPKTVMNQIGLLDPMFPHGGGDFDYGLRAIEAGIPVLTTKDYIGQCELNPNADCRHRKDGLTVARRFKRLYSPLGYNPVVAFKYVRRHWGMLSAVKIYVRLHYQNLLSDRLYHALCK